MRHLKGFKTLNRNHSHRKALYRNMLQAFFKNERIQTTTVKAKEIRRLAEKLITKSKVKTLHNIRIISKVIKDKSILMKLFDEIAPRYIERKGGYTRVVKLARRMGDGADMAYLELIEEKVVSTKKKKKKKVGKEDVIKQELDKKQPVVEKETGEKSEENVTEVVQDEKNEVSETITEETKVETEAKEEKAEE